MTLPPGLTSDDVLASHKLYIEAVVELARRYIDWYCYWMYGWPVGEVPMHGEWDQHIEGAWAEGLGAGIQAPRDHAKTSRIARGRMSWELGRGTEPDLAWCPDLRIKLFQNTDENAVATVMLVRSDISGERYRAVFPKAERDPEYEWSKHKIYLKRRAAARDPSFEGRAILSSATSGRGDLILYDDICDWKNSVLEPTKREKIVRTVDADITNLGEPHTRKAAIGTAWHPEDANAYLMRNVEWRWVVYRIQEQPGGPMVPLWNTKWDIPALEKRRREIGEWEFERGFNNRPPTEGYSLVNWNSVKACMDDGVRLGETPFSVNTRVAGYDLAISKSDQAAYFVAFVLGMGGDGRIIPLEIVRDRVPFRQQVETVKRLEQVWHPQYHVVENNAYQEALIEQVLSETQFINVEPFTTGKQKMDPFVGLPSLGPTFDQHRILIPTKGGHDGSTPSCECPLCVWLRELHYFPAATTDAVMAFWFAVWKIRQLHSGASAMVSAVPSSVASELAADSDLF